MSAGGVRAPAVTARDVGKRFGKRWALSSVSLEAAPGELVAVIGPNGAGKTTLLKILAGVQAPTVGEVSRIPGRLGWVPQQPAFYRKLSATENLRLFARLEGLRDVDGVARQMLDEIGLRERGADPVAELSGGNQQRVNVAIGLIGTPAMLLLDEPTAALDLRQRNRFWDFVRLRARTGACVVCSTHNVEEAERYADRVVVLVDGESRFAGSPSELRQAVGDVARPASAPSQGIFEAAFARFLEEGGA